MSRFGNVLLIGLFMLAGMAPAAAQETDNQNSASVRVSEQLVTGGKVTVDSVVMPQDGWLVINAVVDGQLGPTIGFTQVQAGESAGIDVAIDPVEATPQAVAVLHTETDEIGKYEFDGDPTLDPLVSLDSGAVLSTFRLTAITVWDQMISNNTVMVGAVVSDQPTFVSIRADENGQPGTVLGSASVPAGTTVSIPVSIQEPSSTGTLWATLHTDAGTTRTFEFDGQDGADMPVMLNSETAQTSFNLSDQPVILKANGDPMNGVDVPSLQVSDQNGSNNGTTGTLTIDQVTAPANGWVEVHVDAQGHPGKGLGWTRLSQGTNSGITVDLDINKIPAGAPQTIPSVVWAMVHVDDHESGVFDYGKIPGADAPVVLNGTVVMTRISIGGGASVPDATATEEPTPVS